MRLDLSYLIKLVLMLAALGAVVLYGSRIAGRVARKVPA